MRRILTQLRGSQVLPLAKQLREWSKELSFGNLGELLDAKSIIEPKERLRYRVAFALVMDWVDGNLPCEMSNIREMLVWGESLDDENLKIEYRFRDPVHIQAPLRRR